MELCGSRAFRRRYATVGLKASTAPNSGQRRLKPVLQQSFGLCDQQAEVVSRGKLPVEGPASKLTRRVTRIGETGVWEPLAASDYCF